MEQSKKHVEYHVGLAKGEIGRYVILPGDPGRVEKIASFLDDPKMVAFNREYKTYTGSLEGEKVSVCSTGIGAPSAAIAVEELIRVGADTFIRVGTAGMIQDYFQKDDVIIATAAVRDEGTTSQYIPREYPAVAHVDVVLALREAALQNQVHSHVGIVQSKDSFYGETRPETLPLEDVLKMRWKAWQRGNVLASEMEASALFVVSSIRKARAGCILNNRGDMEKTIGIAIDAVRMLIRRDRGE